MDEINIKYKKNPLAFVGTAGGTNLMGIGSALSAFVHRFSVYSTLDSAESGKNPELSVEISNRNRFLTILARI